MTTKHLKRKIVHLTSVHSPLDARILYKECKSLAKQHYEVVLIAPTVKNTVVDNVKIHGVRKVSGRLQRMTKTVLIIYREAVKEKAKSYHFHDPELILVGLALKIRGKKVVYDVHEDFPRQLLSKAWIRPPPLRRFISWVAEKMENAAVLTFDGIVAATPKIADRFPKEKTVVVQNFPVHKELACAKSGVYGNNPANLAYVGAIAEIRGIYEILQALDDLPERFGAKLLLAGEFSSASLDKSVRNKPGWTRVEYLGWLDRSDIVELLSQSRIGLVTLHPIPNYLNDSYPVKLFEYMSAGIPVIASDFPLWRNIVEGAGCGLLVDPLNPKDIKDAIQWLLENPNKAEEMGRKGLEAVETYYNWDTESSKLLMFYDRLFKSD